MIRSHVLAAVSVLTLAAASAQGIEARISLELTDLELNPITTVAPGEEFMLRAIAQDVRSPAPEFGSGVFAAYLDVAYDQGMATVAPGSELVFDPFFNLVQTGEVDVPGAIIGAGSAATSIAAPGNDPQLVWSLMLTATAPGTLAFAPSFDFDPFHETLLYLRDGPLENSDVEFSGATITVVPEPSSLALAGSMLIGLAAAGCRRKLVSQCRV